MNPTRPGPHNLLSLPTLTEVIEMPAPARRVGVDVGLAENAMPLSVQPMPVEEGPISFAAFPIDEEEVVQRVLTDLQRNADLMLEYRLRQALSPALARLTETLIQDVREELVVTLRDVVARAVSQELARQRGR